ncbi:MAG: sugar phosphate isomerase/epimerase [Thermodesulfobacteriota bacterium]
MLQLGVSLSPRGSEFGPLLFAGDLEAGLEAAGRLGYTGVELSLLDSGLIDRDWLQARLAKLNLKVYTIATAQTYYADGCSLYDEDEDRRGRAVTRFQGHIDLAAELEARVVIGGIRGRLTAPAARWPKIKAAGRRACLDCLEAAARRGVTLLLEPINRYETNLFNTIAESLDFIEDVGGGHLKLLADTFHMNIEEASLEESLIQAGPRLGYVHFADSNRRAPGLGHLNFSEVWKALRAIGYAGPIGIEVLPWPDDYQAMAQAVSYVRGLTAVD